MKKLLETLYITTPESYLFERNGNICISIGGAEKAAVPITQVNSIVLFGKNTLSTALLSFCSKNDVTITFLSENGFFLGRLCGPVSGNVLLRKRQYETLADTAFANRFVKDLLFCKLRNSRSVLVRYARTASDEAEKSGVAAAAADLTAIAIVWMTVRTLIPCAESRAQLRLSTSLALTICSPVRRDTALRREVGVRR